MFVSLPEKWLSLGPDMDVAARESLPSKTSVEVLECVSSANED